jgi:hypothetical protein
MEKTFSERYPHEEPDVPVTVRDDAPAALREALPQMVPLEWSTQRSIVCDILLRRPDPNNWSEWPNVAYEVTGLIDDCPWWHVYDIAEAYWQQLGQPSRGAWTARPSDQPTEKQDTFVGKLNGLFRRHGIGWEMTSAGKIEMRGGPLASPSIADACRLVSDAGWPNTLRELEQARADLGRRPEPDVTGVVQHGSAALESVVRQITGSAQSLGQAAKRLDYSQYPPVLRDVLETVLNKLYGYASSDRGGGRHGSETIQIDRADAALFLGMVSCAIEYLMAKR